jgi:predicted nucleic acid-binding protein
MDLALLDTDILSEVLKKKNPHVLSVAGQYLAEHDRLALSAITFYEIVRGLRANKADRGLADFLAAIDDFDVLGISLPILRRAADLWAEARRGGHPRGDADLIIAATALETQRVLVTGNRAHFEWIRSLTIVDWRSGVD